MKVDWTPELHRRFVQAVEQLGVDKAVPSRILEIMGIDCLTRHNIASHLQVYSAYPSLFAHVLVSLLFLLSMDLFYCFLDFSFTFARGLQFIYIYMFFFLHLASIISF